MGGRIFTMYTSNVADLPRIAFWGVTKNLFRYLKF